MQSCRVGLRFALFALVQHVVVADRSDDIEVSLGVNTRGSFNSLQTLQDVKAAPNPPTPTSTKNASSDAIQQENQRLKRQVEELEESRELRKELEQAREQLAKAKEEQAKSTPTTPKVQKDTQKINDQKKASETPAAPQPKLKGPQPVEDEDPNPFGNVEDSLLEKRLEVAKLDHKSETSASPQSPPLDANERLRLRLINLGYMKPGKATAHEVTEAIFAEAARKRKEAHRFDYREASAPRLIPRHRPKESVNKGFADFMKQVQQDDSFARTSALLQEGSKEVQTHEESPDDSAIFQPFGDPKEADESPREIDRVALAKNIAAREKNIHDKAVRERRKEKTHSVVKDILEQAKKVEQEQSRHGNVADAPVQEQRSVQPHAATNDGRAAVAQTAIEKPMHTADSAAAAQAKEEPRSMQPHIRAATSSGRKAVAQTAIEKPPHAADSVASAPAKEARRESKALPANPNKEVHLAAQKVDERDDDDDGPAMMEDIPEDSWEFSRPGSEKISRSDRVALSMFSDNEDKDPTRPALPPDSITTKTEKATEHALKKQQSKSDPQKQTEAKLSAQEAEIQKLQEQIAALQARSSQEEQEDSDQEDSDESRTPSHELASDVIMQAS